MKNNNLSLMLLIALVVFAVVNVFSMQFKKQASETITYTQFMKDVKQDKVKSVVLAQSRAKIFYKDKKTKLVNIFNDPNMVKTLNDHNVEIAIKDLDASSRSSFLPYMVIFAVIILWLIFRRNNGNKSGSSSGGSGGAGGAFGFGRSKAKMVAEKDIKVRFDDVAGIEEAKENLVEIVDFLKNPSKYKSLGGEVPKGCLLVGSPGTGKTLLAKAVAGEAGVPFFSISGSDFVEMFVGVGAARVRDMFAQAYDNAPCILFIDEIDAVGRHRGAGLGGGNDEREQTLNQLLVEMDGFEGNQGVIVLAATNRPDVLDPALLRPGRFDRQVMISSPDVIGREKILYVHSKKVPLDADVDIERIAQGTPGFSGAELANLVNEAALVAAKNNQKTVNMANFEHAKDKILLGDERRSMVMIEKERALTAYHEAGHAIVSLNVEDYYPLHKVTIVPRGKALGVTISLPDRDLLNYTHIQLKSQLAVMFGGRVAEEMIYGKNQITTGASNDIQQATNIARRMVTEFGYSDKLGRIKYSENQEEVFLGHSVAKNKNISERTASLIDEEIMTIIEEAEKQATNILKAKKQDLEILATALLKYESLTGKQVNALLTRGNIDALDSNELSKYGEMSIPHFGK